MSENDQWFHKAEYGALRTEILATIGQIDRLMYSCIVAVAVVIAWLELNKTPQYFSLCPLVIVLVGFAKTNDRRRQIHRLGSYIKNIESVYANPALAGWEHSLATPKFSFTHWVASPATWSCLLLGAIVFALYRYGAV